MSENGMQNCEVFIFTTVNQICAEIIFGVFDMAVRKENGFFEIDIIEVLQALWHRAWIIAITAVLFAGAMFSYAYYRITPLYQASVLMYVNNSSISLSGASLSINQGDITAAKSLVDTYMVILDTRTTLEEVIEQAGVNYSYAKLSSMITSNAVNNTEIFRVTVTSANPSEAAKIANTIAQVLPEKISSIVDGSSVRVVDYAVIPRGKVSPNMARYTVLGFVLGVIVASFFIILAKLRDDLIHNEDYLIKTYSMPMLAVIPDLRTRTSQYGYYRKSYRYAYAKATKPNKPEDK